MGNHTIAETSCSVYCGDVYFTYGWELESSDDIGHHHIVLVGGVVTWCVRAPGQVDNLEDDNFQNWEA